MMRIELFKTSPDRAGRYFVRFDNGETLRLYRQTVEDFGLYTGMELMQEEFDRLRLAASEMSAKMRAVRIISATSISKKDLESRLIQKGEKPSQAKEAIGWLEELHLLDDARTAEQIVHSCISKGYGLSRAKQALYEKRIPRELWEDALSDYPDQKERIVSFLKARLPDPGDAKATKKAIDALLRRGHGYGEIRAALSELQIDSEDFLEE